MASLILSIWHSNWNKSSAKYMNKLRSVDLISFWSISLKVSGAV